MLGKTEGKRGWQRMRLLDNISDSVDINPSKLWEIVKDREAWSATVHEVANSWTRLSEWTQQPQTPNPSPSTSPLATTSLYSMWVCFCFTDKFLCVIILDSIYKWHHMVFKTLNFLISTPPAFVCTHGVEAGWGLRREPSLHDCHSMQYKQRKLFLESVITQLCTRLSKFCQDKLIFFNLYHIPLKKWKRNPKSTLTRRACWWYTDLCSTVQKGTFYVLYY